MKLLILIFIIALLLSACATVPTNPGAGTVTVATFDLSTSPYVNQSGENKTQPIAVTVYQLKQLAEFQQGDFISLISNPASALGDDYVSSATYILKSNSSQVISISPNPNTQYLAVVAQYQSYQGKNWRWSTKLSQLKGVIKLRINAYGISNQ